MGRKMRRSRDSASKVKVALKALKREKTPV
jgi:hypothetical protein